jgi:hypothetical protein
MSAENNQSNFDFNISFDPLLSENEEPISIDIDSDCSQTPEQKSVAFSLREIWKRQLAKQEEKFNHEHFAGELAQRLLIHSQPPLH